MRILAIDTSTSVMGVALMDEKKVYAEAITNLKKNHSTRLMPTVQKIFSEVNWLPEEIDLFAVAKGPGSYTGVRIGVTTAKTLSWTLNKPLIGISTLEAMAYEHSNYNGFISPMIDARRGQAYTGLYRFVDGEIQNIIEDKITLVSNWAEHLKGYEENVIFVGDDTEIHKEEIITRMRDRADFSKSVFNIVRPSLIGLLAKQRFDHGEIDNSFDFAPQYLQLAEAEAKWLEKQKG